MAWAEEWAARWALAAPHLTRFKITPIEGVVWKFL